MLWFMHKSNEKKVCPASATSSFFVAVFFSSTGGGNFPNSFQVNIKSSNFNLVCSESVTFTVITHPAFSACDATVSVFQNAEHAVSDNLYLSLLITLQSGMKSTDGPLKLSISNLSSSLSLVLVGERLCERHCSNVKTNIGSLYFFSLSFFFCLSNGCSPHAGTLSTGMCSTFNHFLIIHGLP